MAHVLALLAQAGIAGEFMSGTDGVVKFHEGAAWAVLALCVLQIALAAVAMRSGDATLWLVIGSVLIFLAEGLQFGTGFARFLRVHIPLGVIAFGAVLSQTVWQFRKK